MRIPLIAVAVFALLTFACAVHAEDSVKADKLVDGASSTVSYDIKSADGDDLVMTAGYSSERPKPEIESLDIVPRAAITDGTQAFKIPTKEGSPIEIQYTYSAGARTDMKVSSEPSSQSAEDEYSQSLTVQSNGGYMISFTFIWQGKDLKEVRIEPLVNPFS